MSLARELKQKNPSCSIVYIGHKGDKFDSLQEGFHDFDFIGFVNAGKFRRYHGESVWQHLTDIQTLLLNARDFFRVIGSIGKAWRILAKVKPDVVFSKGSFVAVPVGIAAHLRRIPIVTHDSDVVPGLANRIIGRWAVAHATGMPAEFYNYPKEKTRYTGIPIDSRIKSITDAAQKKIKKEIGLHPASLVLLIAGGGLGSRDLNDKVLKIAPELLTTYPSMHIVHIAGQNNEQEVKNKYRQQLLDTSNKHVSVLGFSSEFYKYVAAADLIVSRAGATALAEYAAASKPCILVPSPFLTGGHQLKNAEKLKENRAAEIVPNNAPPEALLGKIVTLLGNPKKRLALGRNLGATAKPDAAQELADLLLKIAAGR